MSFVMLGEVARSLREDPPRRRFIIADLLPVGPVLLYGASGSGKTGIATRTAVSVAAGLSWADRSTVSGSVLYVAGEDLDGAKERLVAAAVTLSLDPARLPIAVMEAPADGLVHNAARIAIVGASQSLSRQTEQPVALIIVDTLAASFGPKSQDDATAVGEFMNHIDRTARELSCAVLCLHHTGKDLNAGMRGSQVFFDRADAVLRVKRGHDASSFITVQKMRNRKDGDRFAFDIASTDLPTGGGPVSVQVVTSVREIEPASESVEEGKARQAETLRSQMLATLIRLAGTGPTDSKAWQEACYALWPSKSPDNQRKTFSKNRKALIDEGLISLQGSGENVTVTVTDCRPVTVLATPKPENVTVTVTDPPSIEGDGGDGRTGRSDLSQEKNGTASSRRAEEGKGSVERTNVLSPAEGNSEIARAGDGDMRRTGTEG